MSATGRGRLAGTRPLAILVLASALSYALGLSLGQPWLLPVLNTLPAYPLMVARLRAGDRRGAVVAMWVWALALAVFGTLAFASWPSDPGGLVLNGPAYRDEMLHWVRTGVGAEGDIRQFLPQHLLHLGAFVVVSLATASLVSILGGAVLMNYMDYYVASLFRAGTEAWATALLGWQPWAIFRVAGFCVLGAVLAEPLLARMRPYPYAGLRAARGWLLLAAALILADWTVKWALAPTWGLWLRGLLP